MASIIEMYESSEHSELPAGKNKDKTPISPDGGRDLATDEKALEQARGGNLDTNKYSDSVER